MGIGQEAHPHFADDRDRQRRQVQDREGGDPERLGDRRDEGLRGNGQLPGLGGERVSARNGRRGPSGPCDRPDRDLRASRARI